LALLFLVEYRCL